LPLITVVNKERDTMIGTPRKSLTLGAAKGAQLDGWIIVTNPPARRLWAAAIVCFAIGSTMAAESVPPVCVAADLRLTTLIEAHGEAQDVAADTLAQAFFTVMEARKACKEGHVEAAMKLYEGIPLGPLPPETITD
jgi:hypothetical protein